MQNIGARLRAALEAKGLPCREVASKAGIDQSYLLRLEKGMFEAGSSPLRAIANALACSLAYVYGEQEALEGKEDWWRSWRG